MVTVILMAVFTAVNFLAMRIFARVNSTITWWKVAVPVFTIIVLLFKFHPGNFTAGGAGFMPGGIHGLFAALPLAGIIFAYSGFEQADQLAGEIKNPGRNLPRAIIIAVLIGTVIYTLLQVAFIGALPPDARYLTGSSTSPTPSSSRGRSPVSRPWPGSPGWRSSCGSTRSSPRPAPASSTRPEPRGSATAWPETGTPRSSSARPTPPAFRGSG